MNDSISEGQQPPQYSPDEAMFYVLRRFELILPEIVEWADGDLKYGPKAHLTIARLHHEETLPDLQGLCLQFENELGYLLHAEITIFQRLIFDDLQRALREFDEKNDLDEAIRIMRRAYRRVYEKSYREMAYLVARMFTEYVKAGGTDYPPVLNDLEQALIVALGKERLVGEKLAERADRDCDSTTKATLAGLVRRKVLENNTSGVRDQRGYTLRDEYHYLLEELSPD